MALREDPLQQVPLSKMEELSKRLLSDAPNSLPVYGLVQTSLRWNDTDASQKILVFSTDNNRFDNNCGIVGIRDKGSNSHSIILYCFGEDKALRNALLTTGRLKWNSPETTLHFIAVPQNLMPLVESFLSQSNFKVHFRGNYVFKWKTPDQRDSCDYTYPTEVRLAPLGMESLELIKSQCIYNGPGVTDYIGTLIKHNLSMGVYSRNAGELCAWVLFNEYFLLTLLHTMEGHRRKGYGQLLVNAMCERFLSDGLTVGAIIAESNTASLKLFESLQFQSRRDSLVYVFAKPSTSELPNQYV